jgi:Fur family ferric uptake transcriptional regulator
MNDQEIQRILRAAGLRATKPRIALVSLFQKSPAPLPVTEIVETMKDTIDMVTVYRMIEALTKAGILREVNLHGDKARFELTDTKHDHHHIVCTNCKRIEDFTDDAHEKIEQRVLTHSKDFSSITDHSFDLYGLCNACAR